ncbi:hypothetical protein LINGRAHAP2_LOCUS13836 [Linum grandiflorum]
MTIILRWLVGLLSLMKQLRSARSLLGFGCRNSQFITSITCP